MQVQALVGFPQGLVGPSSFVGQAGLRLCFVRPRMGAPQGLGGPRDRRAAQEENRHGNPVGGVANRQAADGFH